MDSKLYCEKCEREIDPKKATWLEYSLTDGKFYTDTPEGHESQGAFPFGPECRKNPSF